MNAENISTHSLYPSPSFLNGACTLGLGSKAPEGQLFFRSPGNLLRALLLIHLLFSTLYLLRRFPKILESLPCEVLSSIKCLLIVGERSTQKVGIVIHRLVRKRLEGFLLSFDLPLQFLHQCSHTLRLLLKDLHTIRKEPLCIFHIALLSSNETLGCCLVCLE